MDSEQDAQPPQLPLPPQALTPPEAPRPPVAPHLPPSRRTLHLELGPSTAVVGVVALLAGIAIGHFLPARRAVEVPQAANAPAAGAAPAPARGFGSKDVKAWAADIGLDVNAFSACFDSRKYLAHVRTEFERGVKLGVEGTPAFFIGNQRLGFTKLEGAQPFEVFKATIDSYVNGTAAKSDITVAHEPGPTTIGRLDAPVQIYEFSDFQCLFCRSFYRNTLPELERTYVQAGQVALVYQEYPLTQIHPGAIPYALAAKCAQEQGKWRAMHDRIFDEQAKLGEATIPYGD